MTTESTSADDATRRDGAALSEGLGAVSVHAARGSVADQCRALGLTVGDTIEGAEGGNGWWNTTRLTLLWLGKTEAAWLVTDRSSRRPDWSEPREAVNWTLSCRDWRKVGPNVGAEPTVEAGADWPRRDDDNGGTERPGGACRSGSARASC